MSGEMTHPRTKNKLKLKIYPRLFQGFPVYNIPVIHGLHHILDAQIAIDKLLTQIDYSIVTEGKDHRLKDIIFILGYDKPLVSVCKLHRCPGSEQIDAVHQSQ